MTKYHIKINKDWNYDDLVGEEVLLFRLLGMALCGT